MIDNKSLFELDVFEKMPRSGGRLALAKIRGKFYETGGSIIHEENRYMRQFVQDLGEWK